MSRVLRGARIFDGERLLDGHELVLEGETIAAIRPETDALAEETSGILMPGFVDLQVNGGGGVMLGDAPSVATLRRMAEAHMALGCAAILPTLITADRATTSAAIAAATEACRQGVPGIAGLHLEGPHLDPRRKGAHSERLIRPMEDADLATYLDAARALPCLKITLAPESATPVQIAALAGAGVLVSLGHSDCDQAGATAAFAAGARCVTHLFNAMSGLGHRAPGLVGAALDGDVAMGIIADGHHVDPVTLRIALRARGGQGAFLVSDAMAVAGTDLADFTLDGREIRRQGGRLTLADGTLAGADLDLARAIAVMTGDVGWPLPEVLAMATRRPAALIGRDDLGRLAPGLSAPVICLAPDGGLHRVSGRAAR
ncbi:N-acetylglucosamine-6-phosphate deacetylase [Mesobacterium pallidum]|uniref:N-acetylglucosamine-6-phosphate deacetylase n=1 Tax=Mesobacterium pallidum TaxID=2872037 RepID=UPI001EE25925|nr:N-acetylglucosamine-6-phosphate deacetylase [Mesobacterium pallidum]